MLERECLLNAWVMDYLRKLADGIDESEMDIQPSAGLNTPRWIFGHLAVSADFAAKWAGAPPKCQRAWYKAYAPGTKPETPVSPAPTKQELVAVIEGQCAAVAALLRTATPEAMAKPHDFAPVLASFPTIGDFLAHLLTTHPMLHLGQLSVWRRLRGKPAVLGF